MGSMTQMDSWTQALATWERGDPDGAASLLENLLATSPETIQARHLYGVIMVDLGDYDEAVLQLGMACAGDPDNDEAWSNLGNAQRLAGRPAEAEGSLRSGLQRNPDNPRLHFNLGLALEARQRPLEAEAAFERACDLDRDDQAAWLHLGRLRYARADHAAAVPALLRAAALEGEDALAAKRLAGFALADCGRPQEAERLLAGLCPQHPAQSDDFHLLSQLLYCRMELCDWRQLEDMVARCRDFIAAGQAPVEPFSFQLLPGITAADQLALTAGFVHGITPATPLPQATGTEADPARRLRLGYLSADFHDHAVMRLLTGVLEHHDHSAFEIHAFSYGPRDEGEMRRRIVAACDRFHDVSTLFGRDLAQRIADAGIDILVDLTGWTGNTRSAALGYRPASIQVNWLGYSGTLGSRRFADYLIGDPVATPLADQETFAETLALMPACCQPNDASRRIGEASTRVAEGLPERGFVFCCFSRPLKITPEIFACWCELLDGTPGSVLWLYAANDAATANLRTEATRRGIDPGRLVFSPSRPPEQHLARLALADLALDTFPFGAHTTASDALWAGVPVLTLMGETLPGRVTASMLKAIGLDELVSRSLGEYRNRALKLTRDADRMQALRARLAANRLSSPLFDTQGFAVELEALLRRMWQAHCAAAGSFSDP